MTALGLGDVAVVPVPRAARPRVDPRRLPAARGARRDRGARRPRRPPADADRPPARPAAGRPPARADGARGGAPRLRPRGARDRRRAVDPGPARAARGAARPGRTRRTSASTCPGSDLLSIVALWDHLRAQQRALSGNQFRRLCRAEFLNYLRVREWQDLFSQLRQVAGDLGHPPRQRAGPARSRPPGRCSPGCSRTSGCATATAASSAGARGSTFTIARGLGAGAAAAAVGDGGRARRDEPAVGPPGGGDRAGVGRAARRPPRAALVRRAALGSAAGGAAVTAETVTLYGLPIVSGRTVPVDRVDRRLAREMFIRLALVGGEWSTHHAFVARNAAVPRAGRRARGAGAARAGCSTTTS